MNNESVLDQPKGDLDPSVWIKNGEKYSLTEEANSKIELVSKWVIENSGLDNAVLHITGSITSNQYSEKSDIDLHFSSPDMDDEKADELNKTIRKQFDEQIRGSDQYQFSIGSHPIEIYFQGNQYQDMMSVGCYDFFRKEWIVGPQISANDEDPYAEYYQKDMENVNSVIDDIRNVILEAYEILIVINNAQDQNFIDYECSQLSDKLAKASSIFTQAREFRKMYSSPKSKEDALALRSSADWKIADSSFKLLDKFGYLGILRTMTQAWEQIQNNEKTVKEIIPELQDKIYQSIVQNSNIDDNAKKLYETMNTEEFGKSLAVLALIVSMISIPGVTNSAELKKNLQNIPAEHMKMKDKAVTKAINDSSIEHKKFGGFSYANTTNMIATTTYDEGMLDYIKPNAKGQKYDDRVLQCIIWTMINRAGKNPDKIPSVILEDSQYFGSKHITGRTNDTYVIYHPGLGYDKKTWEKCNEFAVMALKGTLPMPKDDNGVLFGKRNMIANKDIDNANSYEKWGKKCDFTVGGQTKHWYGYDKSHDGYRSTADTEKTVQKNSKTWKIYKIKQGDKLINIAKKFHTTVEKILKDNPSIKDKNQIFIGKKIKL